MTLKYIIIQDGNDRCAVVFSPLLNHNTIAKGHKCLSAGFCHLVNNGVGVWGGSTTLGINSLPEDADLIKLQFFGM